MKELFVELNELRIEHGNFSFFSAFVFSIIVLITLLPFIVIFYGFQLGWEFSQNAITKLGLN